MPIEFIVVALLATSVAVVAVWRPKWVWAPMAALAAFIAYVFGSDNEEESEDTKHEPEPTTSVPDHTPEDRSETMVNVARDDDVSDDLDDELDDISSDADRWRADHLHD